MSWLKELLGMGARHYTCTSNEELERTPGSEREHINYDALYPHVRERLGRDPKNQIELIITAEQVIRNLKRRE